MSTILGQYKTVPTMINYTERKTNVFKIVLIIISFSLFFISLTQNAFYVGESNSPEEVHSLYAFLFGWMVFLGSGISWIANPLLTLSWVYMFKKIKYSQYCGILAVLFAASFLVLKSVVTNEGGVSREIVSYDTGYWLWLSSCVINCIGIFIIRTSC